MSRARAVSTPRVASRAAVTGPAPRNDPIGASIVVGGAGRGVALPSALVRETQLVVTEVEHVAFVDALVVDAHALVVDAIGRPEILDEIGPVSPDDRRVLARDVAVLDGKIGRLGAAADDELVLVDGVLLVVEPQVQRRG